MTATITEDVVQTATTDEPAQAAHIVWVPPGSDKTAHAVVLEARVHGLEIEALCGHRWIPSKDPEQLPVCAPCLEIYQQPGEHRGSRDQLPGA